jgi:cytochrome P450
MMAKIDPGTTFDFSADRGSCPFDPPQVYTRLRSERRLSQIRLWDGSKVWLVTRHADVRAVLSDDRLSADNSRPGFPLITPVSEVLTQENRTFIRLDPPEHDRLRQMVDGEFTMKQAKLQRPRIREIVDGFASQIKENSAPADLVAKFALPIPSMTICAILGVPYEAHEDFQGYCLAMLRQDADGDEVCRANENLSNFLEELIVAKAERPANDLLSKLAKREKVRELSRQDAVSMARLLLIAGHETTANQIALSILALLRNPEQFAALRDDATLIPGAVDELLRYLTVIHTGVPRVAISDVEIDGHCIKANEGVLCYLPAANRDGERFEDPDALNVRRKGRTHLAFGFGIHQCIGQSLARVEIQEALAAIIRHFPELRLAIPFEDLSFRQTANVYGVYELPASW